MEQATGFEFLELLTIPFKLASLFAGLAFVADLSCLLHRRKILAAAYCSTLVLVVVGMFFAFLPWRDAFAKHFSNSMYRWYYPGMPSEHPGHYGDFNHWETQWAHRLPHRIEIALLVVFLAFLSASGFGLKHTRFSGCVVGVIGYLILFLVPMFTNLIVWDYDTFLRGIVCDSISMDLMPIGVWFAGDYSIFLYVLLLSIFCVSSGYWRISPRVESEPKLASGLPLTAAPFTAQIPS